MLKTSDAKTDLLTRARFFLKLTFFRYAFLSYGSAAGFLSTFRMAFLQRLFGESVNKNKKPDAIYIVRF